MFRLKKSGEKNIYLSLTNSHNGYYSHGFSLVKVNIKGCSEEEEEDDDHEEEEDGESFILDSKLYYRSESDDHVKSSEYDKRLKKYLTGDPIIIDVFHTREI